MAKRFASVCEADLKQLIIDKDSKNTKVATKNAVNIFLLYLREKQLQEDYHNYSACELDETLERFFVELRSKTGELYKKSSFCAIRHGLNRSLDVDIVNGPEFPRSQKAFKAMTVELKRQGVGGVDHHPPIESEDLAKIYQYFNIQDPEQLQQKVFFDVMLYFGRRGRENLRLLSIADFALTTDTEGSRYIYIQKDEATKNHQLDTNTAQASMHAIPSQDERCPVSTFLRYKRMLPPGCTHLFPRPLKEPTQAGYMFTKQSLGHNKLGTMMSVISEKAGLSRRYSNHSIRATSVHVLDSNNVPTRHIMTVTGHKAESSLKTYTGVTDQKMKKSMSHTLSKSVGLNISDETPSNSSKENVDPSTFTDIDILNENSLIEPVTGAEFDSIIKEFDGPDGFDEVLRNLEVPVPDKQTYAPDRQASTSDNVINYYPQSSQVLQTLPAPIISGQSANVTINYNFYNHGQQF